MDDVIKSALEWDVMVGVSRRSWARNENSMKVVREWNEDNKGRGQVTEPELVAEGLLDRILKND